MRSLKEGYNGQEHLLTYRARTTESVTTGIGAAQEGSTSKRALFPARKSGAEGGNVNSQ